MPRSSYDFIVGDGFDETDRMVREGDTYDTDVARVPVSHGPPVRIIYKLGRFDFSSIIIDTAVLQDVTAPIIRVGMERTGKEAQLYFAGKSFDLGGVPSITAVHLMLRAAGFQPSVIVPTIAPPLGGTNDYRDGRRFTIIGLR